MLRIYLGSNLKKKKEYGGNNLKLRYSYQKIVCTKELLLRLSMHSFFMNNEG